MILAPPTVTGPVVSTSPQVRVDGVLAGATVEVTADDGTRHADGVAHANGTVWLPVGTPFTEGTTLVATQSLGGATSVPSVHGTPVLPPPPDLPAPVFEALLNQCSDSALLAGLVPGAEVTVKRGTTVLAVQVADRTRQWIPLSAPLGVGTALTASQTLPGVNPSPVAWSDPVILTDIENGVGVPQVVGPLTACQSEINFAGVVPTARVTAEFEDGSSASWYAPAEQFRALLPGRLVEGAVVVRQLLPTCGYVSGDGKTPVGPEQIPPKPAPQAFCPETRRIAVDGLVAGATVEFSTISWDNTIGGWGPETPLMTAGAAGGLQQFDLPHVVGGGPGPIVNIRVRQTLCTRTSEPGFAREYIRPDETGGIRPSARPRIVDPVYSCARTVRLDPSGWGIGVLRSRRTGRQLADAFAPYVGVPMVLPLWFPLDAGDELVVDYTGCDAPQPTDAVEVRAVPDPLPVLKIVPPLPGDTDLVISGALPGARVVALVGHRIRSARTTTDGSATLPLGAPLEEDDEVWAYQRLCGATGNVEGSVVVRRGKLTLSVAPTTVVSGTATTVTVTATRTDTGAVVGGLPVVIGAASVGITGTAFALTPGAAGPLTGTVRGGPRYADAAFTVTVTAPPPPPTGATLTLQLGGFGGYGSPISVTKVTWQVQPNWATGPVTGAGTTATVSLPPPPAGTPNPLASVYLTEFEGTRTDNGIPFKLWPDVLAPMTNVGLTKPTLHVGFLLTTEIRDVYDDNGNIVDRIWVAVIRWQGTA
ncbi:hypothetical protein [Polymorphospora rubra]|uniref:hypothetical protein n=1 Tax=Polymorphospora rubra TaxID=338584 RepID=UPI0031DAD98E